MLYDAWHVTHDCLSKVDRQVDRSHDKQDLRDHTMVLGS
jgi:hypothetical protein